MANAYLDSTAAIGLLFRHRSERDLCRAALPEDGDILCSRYVIFEIARGYLRYLIALHNYSLEFTSFADFHLAAHSGQQRFRPYRMHTWLGAFSDYLKTLEERDGLCSPSQQLDEFRAKLRGWIRRGWRRLTTEYRFINDVGCREDLAPPTVRGDERIDQALPNAECGRPTACRLQRFLTLRKSHVRRVVAGLEQLPVPQDSETTRRIASLRALMSSLPSSHFDGNDCFRGGDALICLEAPHDSVVVTKNLRHFEPLGQILNKNIAPIRATFRG